MNFERILMYAVYTPIFYLPQDDSILLLPVKEILG